MTTPFTRRSFLGAAAATSLAGAVGAGPLSTLLHAEQDSAAAANNLPSPAGSGIEHVVVVMMENRSFDHFLGWLPHANGRQAGLAYPDKTGVYHPTYHLTDYQGCALADPDHSYQGARDQYDNGKCDGWLRAGTNDLFPIGFYDKQDLSFLSQAAPYWTTGDKYFAAILGPTYPNRFYQHSAQTDRLDDSTTVSTLPTIWDRLAGAGLTGRYFFSDIPFTALWGARYASISRPYAEFLAACATGTLPQVSFVDPRFEDEDTGTSGDDHPHADIRNGEAFLNQVYNAIVASPNWASTVLVINFDEWGGFFDHVAPPLKPIPATDKALGSDGRIGFRVPGLVISPFARRGYIAKTQLDHTSILKMIEWRWNLDPLSVRDATANNLASVLDFSSPSLVAPRFPVPIGPFGTLCNTTLASSEAAGWSAIKALALQSGFILP